jgi:putative phosphoribosyl transferase
VIFAHGSGSSRLSPRNQMVAEYLQRGGLGTLLFDLLTEVETRSRANVFDIPLLAERLEAATDWVKTQPEISELPIGYFGASTGAGAALVAAAEGTQPIAAVVSRGGRPDLAGDALDKVTAPTLLIVGGNDEAVIGLNRMALERLTGHTKLVIVPGATHLFEEPGTLEEVARLAEEWFVKYLGGVKS